MNISPRGLIAFLLIGVTTIGQLMLGSATKAVAATEAPQALTCNAISGYAYEDDNLNGLRDAAEPAIANVTVELLNTADAVIATAQTDASGFYSFTIDTTLVQATRQITHLLSVAQRTTDWTQAVNVPKFDPALGDLTGISITTSGQLSTTVRVENTDTAPQTLTSTVKAVLTAFGPAIGSLVAQSPLEFIGTFSASTFDGLIDFTGSSGVVFPTKVVTATAGVDLTDAASLLTYTGAGTLPISLTTLGSASAVGSSNINLSLSTRADGQLLAVYGYIPSRCIKVGTYTIREQQPPTYDDGLDTNDNLTPIPGSSGGRDTITVQVTTGQDKPNNNFGEWRKASIGGFVYHDMNDDGVFDSGESVIPETKIYLSGHSISGTLVSISQTTQADGSYNFTGLWSGIYTVTEMQPTGWNDGKDTQGSPETGVTTNDQFATVKLDMGVNGENNNFGELLPPPELMLTKTVGTLAQTCAPTSAITVTAGTPVYYCYKVTNIGNIALMTHTLVDDKLGVLLDNVVINLQPGASTFITAPATIQITTTNVATWTARPPLGPPVTMTTTAIVRVPPVLANAALGDYVWMDTDNDGVQDTDEPGAGKTRVTLYANGAAISNTVTTWQGYYTFTNLTPGVPYTLNFDYNMKNGMTWTVRYAGGNRAKDSNIDKHGNTEPIILKPNEFNRTIDAGIDLGLVIDQVSTVAAVTVGPCPERVITYTLVVDNNGIFTLSDIVLQDNIPTNTTYLVGSASAPPTIEQSSLVWQLPTLKPGDRFSISFAVRVVVNGDNDATTVVNSAHIGNEDFPVLATTINNKVLTCTDKPTAISLLRFEANRTNMGVQLGWATLLEQDTLGFALYRSADAQREHATRLNPDWIASIGRDGGAHYEWMDVSAQSGVSYYYWLQEMTLAGLTNEYGPTQLAAPEQAAPPVAQVAGGGTVLRPSVQPAAADRAPASIALAVAPTAAPVVNRQVEVQAVSVETLPAAAQPQPNIVQTQSTPAPSVGAAKLSDTHSAVAERAATATPLAKVVAQADYQAIPKQHTTQVEMEIVDQPAQAAGPQLQLLQQAAHGQSTVLKPFVHVVTAPVMPSTNHLWIVQQLMLFSGVGAVLAVGLGWLVFAALGKRR